jgi:hypothetical protein
MERVTIRADRALLERARRAARARDITFPQLVRDALEHELAMPGARRQRPSSIGVVNTSGAARERTYEPDADSGRRRRRAFAERIASESPPWDPSVIERVEDLSS